MRGISEMFAELNGSDEYDDRVEGWAHWKLDRERRRVLPRNDYTRARDRAQRAAYVARDPARVREWNRRNQRARRARLKEMAI